MRASGAFAVAALALLSSGCFNVLAKGGGGAKSRHLEQRKADPAAVAVPAGYRVEVVAERLTYPVGVTFDGEGLPVVLEAGYSYGEDFAVPRLVRLGRDGARQVLAEGPPGGPWTGVVYARGAFYVADGGESRPGRILRIDERTGALLELVGGLPTLGDHHANGPALGPDGRLYFATGTATNSGVVGPDNHDFGWLGRNPQFHDVPCEDLELTGWSALSDNPLTLDPDDQAQTGAYQPFGSFEARQVKGQVPCSGAVMRAALEGGAPELVAWGFRNPFGLAFAEDGSLYVTENGFDLRGSRPVFGAADNLWRVEEGRWYGWPDHAEGRRVYEGWDRPLGAPLPKQLIANPKEVPEPVARFGVHSSSNGFDFSRSERFGHRGQAFVAQFGDMAPAAGKVMAPVGFKVVRVELDGGIVHTFMANRAGEGPGSMLGAPGIERPVAARFSDDGSALYVVDFGVLALQGKQIRPQRETGVLWRISRAEAQP
jgi:glucose/arabinose dehydrogenase